MFSSANTIRNYDIRQLVELGVEWIWLGLESSETGYAKLKGSDTLSLVLELQSHGICVHGSTIIGLEHHTPENIGPEIERAISHDTVFHLVEVEFELTVRVCKVQLGQQASLRRRSAHATPSRASGCKA